MMVMMVMMVMVSVNAAPHFHDGDKVDYKGWQVLKLTLPEALEDSRWVEVRVEEEAPGRAEVITHRRRGEAQVAVSPTFLPTLTEELKERGVGYRVVVDDLAKQLEENAPSVRVQGVLNGEMSYDNYMDYEEITSHIHALASRHPELVTLEEVGKSVEGRPVYLLTITSQRPSSLGQEKPIVFLDGGVHAREWISPAATLHILNQLLTSPTLTRDLEFKVMPLVNPDGYITSLTINRFWRKNRSVDPETGCRGVDLNRNFGYKWAVSGSSSKSCSGVYHGKTPFSEPESQAMRDAVLRDANRTEAYVSFHAYGQMILHSWSYSKEVHRYNRDTLVRIGRGMADAIRRKEGVDYVVGTVGELLYTASGGSDDWVAGVAKVPLCYTIELRDQGQAGFLLPTHLIRPSVNDAWLAVKYLAKQVVLKKRQESVVKVPAFPETTTDPSLPTTTINDLQETTTEEESSFPGTTSHDWTTSDSLLPTTTLNDSQETTTERESSFPGTTSHDSTTSDSSLPSTTLNDLQETTTEKDLGFPGTTSHDWTTTDPSLPTTTLNDPQETTTQRVKTTPRRNDHLPRQK